MTGLLIGPERLIKTSLPFHKRSQKSGKNNTAVAFWFFFGGKGLSAAESDTETTYAGPEPAYVVAAMEAAPSETEKEGGCAETVAG